MQVFIGRHFIGKQYDGGTYLLSIAYVIGLYRPCSFARQISPRISREPFNVESLNFTQTSISTWSTATPDDVTIYFRSEVIAKKLSKIPLRRLWVEFIENSCSNDHGILPTYRGQPANLPDMTSLAASNRLQNAIKYCTKVHRTGLTGQRVK